MSRFDWDTSEDVIVRRQGATAVYESEDGDVVIRQQNDDQEDDDVVCIAADRLGVVIGELMHLHNRLNSPPAAQVTLTAAVVRELVAAGLSNEQLLAACERIEAGPATSPDPAVQ